MGSVEISWERSPCVGPPYIRIVISWHDIIISWHDTIISCCVWFEAPFPCKYTSESADAGTYRDGRRYVRGRLQVRASEMGKAGTEIVNSYSG